MATVICAVNGQEIHASQITTRSLTLMPGSADEAANGGAMVGGIVKHEFAFTVPSTSSVGSIKFEYCTTAAGTCTMPTGLLTTGIGAVAENQQGAINFDVNDDTNGAPYLTRAAAAINSGTALTYRLPNIKNPSTEGTFFVRIYTYTSTDATGVPIDNGTVAASTSKQIVLTGTMPESLIFCAGATVPAPGGIPNCALATAGDVDFNQLFSPTDTAYATSQMAASTNATGGYSISVSGPTLKSGTNAIAPMSAQTTGARGTGQFGLNLKANTTATAAADFGTEVAATYDVGNKLLGQAATGYDQPDRFKFSPIPASEAVATSAAATNAQVFTVSYIVNVPGSQTAGEYTTTLTYVCTAKF